MGRWGAIWLLAACDKIYGVHQPVQADAAIDAPPPSCEPMTFDSLRYRSQTTPETWAQARAGCNQYAMDLAVIDEGDSSEIAMESSAGSPPYWLGVSADGSGWLALDGCTPVLNWASGEPMSTNVGDCVVRDLGGLASSACADNNFRGFAGIGALCETPRPSAQCLVLEANSTYELASTVDDDYSTALNDCSGPNKHLVEINSSAELDLVKSMFPGVRFWLGATWSGTGWSSTTSCPIVFAWAANQPDFSAGYTCAYYDGAVHMAGCTGQMARALCETNTM